MPCSAEFRNVFAVLVHESPECVVDLVHNIQYLDPESEVVLYDGSHGASLLRNGLLPNGGHVFVHPAPREMAWGRLHEFAFDCMRFAAARFEFDALTIVDSDQLAVRAGYSDYLAGFLRSHPHAGFLGNAPFPQSPATRSGPAQAAWHEVERWRPFLRRFRSGEAAFPHWSFWPSSVFTRRAVEALIPLFEDPHLRRILESTQIWATEEILFPTLVALLGFKVLANPCTYDYVRYRTAYSPAQADAAMARRDTFWMHPVPRCYQDPLRAHIRNRFGGYLSQANGRCAMSSFEPVAEPQLLLTLPLLDLMDSMEGWLSRPEADLLIGAVVRTLTQLSEPHRIVEVGSYCGRSTVVLASVVRVLSRSAKVHAVDSHEGTVGSMDATLRTGAPTLDRFTRNIARAGLTDVVEVVPQRPVDVAWEQPISLLLVDGLHDYVSVACDTAHFGPWVVDGGYLVFHDYADYYPGVKTFVDHLVAIGACTPIKRVQSMALLRVQEPLHAPALRPILDIMERIEGWLEPDEASLLALVAARAVSCSDPGAIVEVGSHCGRGTVLLASVVRALGSPAPVHAVDRFDSLVGATGVGPINGESAFERFTSNLARAALADRVIVHHARASDVEWHTPVSLLVVDGLHDYANVAIDFRTFDPWIGPGDFVAFHDFTPYYPGVQAFVSEVLRHGVYREVGRMRSLIVLQKKGSKSELDEVTKTERSNGSSAPRVRKKSRLPVQRVQPVAKSSEPLVSCVMPTRDRRRFVPQAVHYFLRQDYPNRELVVVDDGEDAVADLIPDDTQIRYIRLDRHHTIGSKRNVACEIASGSVIVNWDDDDWMAAWRLRYQVEALLTGGADVVGLSTVLFYEMGTGPAWCYVYPKHARPWLHDATFCYRKELWEAHPFPDVSYAVDLRYLWQPDPKRLLALSDSTFYVGIVHPGNTSPKRTSDSLWHAYPEREVKAHMGADWTFYASEQTPHAR